VREELFVESVSGPAGVEVSELEKGWRILVGKEFQRKGAAEYCRSAIPVSSLTGGRRRVMTDAERVERLDCYSSLFARYDRGLLC